MSELMQLIGQQLSPQMIQQIAGQLGADQGQTQNAMAAALPMLIGGLAKNAQQGQGAQQLASALDRDHDGTMLDNFGAILGQISGAPQQQQQQGGGLLGGLLGQLAGGSSGGGLLELAGQFLQQAPGPGSQRSANGAGILGHILGSKQNAVQAGLGQASGLNTQQSGQLLAMLAPMVMGALGKAKQKQGLDAGGLAGMLAGEQQSLQQQGGGLLGAFLDRDNDGDIQDDVAQLGLEFAGKQLLKSFLG